MFIRHLGAGLLLVGTVLVAGCCHKCTTANAPPAVIAAPIPPAPCCPAPAPAPAAAYYAPAPYATGLPH